jgi:EAL domain-containing protein (putative c-di-GMP-specific phosphodiesterase class I)
METVAESVENKTEADMLKEFEAGYFQGYFFAKPEVDASTQGQGEAVCENGDGKAHGADEQA